MRNADDVFELFVDLGQVGAGQVDFVDDGYDFQLLVERQVHVGKGLSFDALSGVDDEDGTVAGGQRARDFVGEVDVARGIEQVELVGLAVLRFVAHGDGVRFDGDAFFALEIHGVEQLVLLVALTDGVGEFEQAIGEGCLAVVDVRDDREVAFQLDIRTHARARIRYREGIVK